MTATTDPHKEVFVLVITSRGSEMTFHLPAAGQTLGEKMTLIHEDIAELRPLRLPMKDGYECVVTPGPGMAFILMPEHVHEQKLRDIKHAMRQHAAAQNGGRGLLV